MGIGTVLTDDKDHEPWLPNRRVSINWRFWRRYERYLLEDRSWPPNVVRVLAELRAAGLDAAHLSVPVGRLDS